MMRRNQLSSSTPNGPGHGRDMRGHASNTGNGQNVNLDNDRLYGQVRNSAVIANLRAELERQAGYLRKERKKSNKYCSHWLKLENQLRELTEDFDNLYNENKDFNALENDRNHWRSRYNYVLRQLIRPYTQELGSVYDDRTAGTTDLTLRRLLEDALQSNQLREQLLASQADTKTAQGQLEASEAQCQSLQKQMLARVDKVLPILDDQLSQDFRALGALVKSLSRSIRPTEDMDVCVILPPADLHIGVSPRHWNRRARKKYYIEAWIWSVLVHEVFSSPFAMFRQSGEAFQSSWELLFGGEFHEGWPDPSLPCENWRWATMEQLVQKVGSSTITLGQLVQSPAGPSDTKSQATQQYILQTRNKVANTIGEKLTLVSTQADLSRVPLIVDKAFSLAMEMSLQRSRLQITWPIVGNAFVEEEMSCLPDPDSEDLEGGNVAFTVSPGLVKWGDANGKNFEERYDIVPSLVHLERVIIKNEHEEPGEQMGGLSFVNEN
ncbi:hypothetical protein HBH56_026530 [Parastagonospora nodorum]|uniref:Uncharacterized protein n=2 Tax=Phaeosphaeria nodorum (strain SN15 / ATCC MYA-4574 / FGSC 10173) TaxID=321614 RepID=A0A7U2F5X9_PHANO|nr:hypothetical protein SNOG_06314 [Parastagonospora nodorum SN15]KAH3918927.1 hypothetical protein HBH56_026530 [Parastagonospora nodorum]EAT86145.2 hypothetical protein SNOG_06314 [Parastagonospora nodorum SN15]KAH3934291.1 hypothetical protein HBH54_055510 [Parastagonospora nodorum]KAH4141513.1 hypothetical protein HBH45_061270 [Parastagonospora nodorum]KAH4161650.1 hypothetical protein HBH44_094860 [Parastagonospora nodorum]